MVHDVASDTISEIILVFIVLCLLGPRAFMEHDGALRRQLEEQEMIVDMERRRLAELQFEKHRMQQFLLSPSVAADSRQSAAPPMASFQSEVFSLDTNSNDYGSIQDDPDLMFPGGKPFFNPPCIHLSEVH